MRNSKYIKYLFGCILLLFCNCSLCFAQLNNTVFEDFNQFFLNPYLVNPAATDSSYRFKICANNLNELGFIKGVNRFYIDADKRINSSRKNDFHFIGVQAINSKIGDYISRSRFHLRYSWFAQVSQKASLCSGFSLGFINYSFLTTQGGTGGSDIAPDGMVGVHYLRPRNTFGFSIQQIFSPVLIPVDQSYQLPRLYNIDFSHQFDISYNLQITLLGMFQKPQSRKPLYSVGLLSDISNIFFAGVNNYCLYKTSFNAGIKHIQVFDFQLMFAGTYSIYHRNIPYFDSTLEIFIALRK